MPTYTFKNKKTGKRKEFVLSYKEYSPEMEIDGEKWVRDLELDLQSTRVEETEAWNGMKSRALGVHPSEINEDQANAKKRGVNITHDRKGNPIFSSRKNRKEYCRYRGVVDYEGGFGDNI